MRQRQPSQNTRHTAPCCRPADDLTPTCTLVALAALIGYHVYTQRQSAVDRLHREVISCLPSEIHDLINVFHFTTKDLESLYARTMSKYPRGEVNLDEFAALLQQQVALVKARRKRERAERELARQRDQYADDREEVILERRIERAIAAGQPVKKLQDDQYDLTELNVTKESIREKEAAADADEAQADAHKDNQFVPIDVYVFFRTSTQKLAATFSQATWPPTKQQRMDVRDLFTGLANLIFDHADLEAHLHAMQGEKNIPTSIGELKRAWGTRDAEIFTRRPQTKLHFAFRVADEDRDGRINQAQAEKMIERLIRTGHVTPESLLQHRLHTPEGEGTSAAAPPGSSVALLPYEYEQRSARQIAQLYWEEIARQRRQEAASASSAPAAAASAAPAAATVVVRPASSSTSDDTISWPEFLAASRYFTDHQGALAYWYLHTPYPNGGGTGAMYRWRHRRMEAWRRQWYERPKEARARDIDHTIQTFLV